jgi:tripartite-type tricarboxylate transporter receptor subunit TctC
MLRTLALIVCTAGSAVAADVSPLRSYPDKPIHLVVPRPAGSQVDTVARLFGQKVAEAMGKAIVVDNASGAAGNIAADRVAKATPDGYTLGLLDESQILINPNLYKLGYNAAKDFAPVSLVTLSSNVLVVHNGVRVKSVNELVALAKTQPGVLNFASGGSGSSPHMAAELFKSTAGVDIVHIPYKGVVMAIPDLLGARVTMMFSPISLVVPLSREGKLRALAVTSAKRSAAVPDLPTIAESYPGFEYISWYGLLAPANTPASVVSRLHAETVKALAAPDLGAKLMDVGLERSGSSPESFAALIKMDIPKWSKLIKAAAITVE